MPSTSRNEETIGIEAPHPIITVGRPHSSSSAAAAACIGAVEVSKEMAVLACGLVNSTLQSGGSCARTNALRRSMIFSGSWPATMRQVILAEALDGITVLVPMPW